MKSLADIAGLSQPTKKVAINYSFDVNPDAKAIQSAILSGEEPQGLIKATPVVQDIPQEKDAYAGLKYVNPQKVQQLEKNIEDFKLSPREQDLLLNKYQLEYNLKAVTNNITDKTASESAKNIADYVSSPLYAKRQANNPEEYIGDNLTDEQKVDFQNSIAAAKTEARLNQLRKTKYNIQDSFKNEYDDLKNEITLSQKNVPSNIAHEQGHAITSDYYLKDKKGRIVYDKDNNPIIVNPETLSSDKYNSEQFTLGGLDKKNKSVGFSLNNSEIKKFTDLANETFRQGDVHYDKNKRGFASEQYGDLTGFRTLLQDNGITKSFGEELDNEKMQKALQNKNITTNPVFKRLFSRYGEKNIIELNNTIAMNKSADNQNFMA